MLKSQAQTAEGEERARYFNGARQAYLAALAFFTPEKYPDVHVWMQAKRAKLEELIKNAGPSGTPL